MKENINLVHANINNLTSLWKTVGTSFGTYTKTSDFEYCEVKDSEWPNRLWLNKPITEDIIKEVQFKLKSISSKITIPIWGVYDENVCEDVDFKGLDLKFKQVGMSLKLDESFETTDDIQLHCVSNNQDAILWSELFKASFGYSISADTIISTLKNINYFIAFKNEIAVGTAILYTTNRIGGIHSVGIPPNMRRNGYAEQIMKLLLNKAIENRYEYATLQASDMGKGLYLKLGFKEQFIIKNYVLKS